MAGRLAGEPKGIRTIWPPLAPIPPREPHWYANPMAQHLPEHGPLRFDDPEDIRRLRAVLDAAPFSDEGVSESLGVRGARAVASSDRPQLLRATARGTPLDTFIRLFLMGEAVDADAARRAAAPMDVEVWLRAGLLSVQGDQVSAAFQLLPFQSLVLAFDWSFRRGTALRPDYVMGIGSSSLSLANATVRRPSRGTVDLGTGCGFQALLAARHSEHVAAVDLNPRAIGLASFNARLNDVPNVEFLQGSFFEPVEGRLFDLVVSNPPFVISPESQYVYRDSGTRGDAVSHDLVRRVPAFLHEGGYCHILFNWAHYADEDWRSRLAGWFEGTGCDAWVLQSDTLPAAKYASLWIQHTEPGDCEQFVRRHQQWMDYYQRERIEAVSGGFLTMRRRSGAANWVRIDDTPEQVLGPAGDSIVHGFEIHDFLEAASDDRWLLDRRLTVSPDVRLVQQLKPSAGGWNVIQARIELTRGLAYVGEVDSYMAELIARCDGHCRLGTLLEEMAARLGQDADVVVPPGLRLVRNMIERGFLLPSEEPGSA